jgi:pyruvate/2-oxoglutarate dehydrogenase complex dihydrolipoamide dehydrogenase (E3) component
MCIIACRCWETHPTEQQMRDLENAMPEPERLDVLILGSGQGGKLLAWHMARSGWRTVVVERRYVGGSCPNIACMPSKNVVWGARVAHLARHAAQFGTMTGTVATDMAKVRQRKREMVEREVAEHLQNYQASGAELIMGTGRSRTSLRRILLTPEPRVE